MFMLINNYTSEVSTSPTASYEAEVIKVGVAMLHGCCGVAQLGAAVVFVASHHCDSHAIWHVVAQGNHLENGERLGLILYQSMRDLYRG